MTWLLLCAAGLGIGLWALAVWLIPPTPSLADSLARLSEAPAQTPSLPPAEPHDPGIAVRLGRPFTGLLRAAGLPRPHLHRDLAITGHTTQTYLAEKASLTLVGLLTPSVVMLLAYVSGYRLPWQFPAFTALLCGVGGFLAPDGVLRAEAERRRADFRHALGAYLNLIHILLAGGSGVDSALDDAATIGRGPAFAHIRRALTTARLTRTSPWAALGDLGDELGVAELVELSAALRLAGTEGAKVRASLAAKAAALRNRSAADAESRANSATERMALPGVVMAAGFLLFLFYPALYRLTTAW
ncbi:type II secretion system F family protein [Streptomyces boninensis]|uniref:type II secretion system F family protein n=1 Tax=Streptomyces boninensis TaxID=2039455 RepID=UPI003B2136B8